MVAGVLVVCHVMPGSGAAYGDALTVFLCAITPCATGLKTLGKFLQPFSLPLLKGEYMRILLYLHWLSHVAVDRTLIDCSTLLPRYANKMDGKA